VVFLVLGWGVQHLIHSHNTLRLQHIPVYDTFPTKEDNSPDLNIAAIPDNVSSIPAFYSRALERGLRLQRTLSKHLETSRLSDLLNLADTTTSARIHSLKTPYSSTAYTTRPTTDSLTLTNSEWEIHTKLISGCHLCPDITNCPCGYHLTQPNADKYHFFNCPLLRKSLLDDAHNLFVNELTNILNTIGFYAIKETQPNDTTKHRPDITLFTASKNLIEFTFRNPCASYLANHKHPLRTLANAEQQKRTKYTPLARFEKAKLTPTSADRFGTLSTSLLAFIDHIAKTAPCPRALTPPPPTSNKPSSNALPSPSPNPTHSSPNSPANAS